MTAPDLGALAAFSPPTGKKPQVSGEPCRKLRYRTGEDDIALCGERCYIHITWIDLRPAVWAQLIATT
jgi:hypothetical protein